MLHRRILFVVAFLVLIALAWVASPRSARAESEPNDTVAQANPLAIGITGDTNCSTQTKTDTDWRRVSLLQDHWYVFEVYNATKGHHVELDLFSADGQTGLGTRDYSPTGTVISRVTFRSPANADYSLRINGGYTTGLYAVRALAKYDEGGTWDSSLEPNDAWQLAYPLQVGADKAIRTAINPPGLYENEDEDTDWFRFDAIQGSWYSIETFNLAPSLSNTHLSISAGDDNAIGGNGHVGSQLVWQAPATGTFFVQLEAYDAAEPTAFASFHGRMKAAYGTQQVSQITTGYPPNPSA